MIDRVARGVVYDIKTAELWKWSQQALGCNRGLPKSPCRDLTIKRIPYRSQQVRTQRQICIRKRIELTVSSEMHASIPNICCVNQYGPRYLLLYIEIPLIRSRHYRMAIPNGNRLSEKCRST